MMDRIAELLEMLLVNLGMALTRLSDEQKTTISLFLASLMLAAVAAHALQLAVRP